MILANLNKRKLHGMKWLANGQVCPFRILIEYQPTYVSVLSSKK